MNKIAFICCYNDKSMVEKLRLSTACLSDYEIEWVLLDNRSGRFNSAASALNYGFSQCVSDIVIFLHQDIVLYDQSTVDRVVQAAKKGFIVGLAGRLPLGGEVVATISDGQEKDRVYNYDFKGKDWVKVLTCDECFIAMNRSVYRQVRGFDEKYFDGWHLYGVDLTLRASEEGVPVVIVRANAWHYSHGTMNKDFDRYKNKLRKRYKNKYKKIYYPCGWTYTSSLKYYGRLFARNIKRLTRERDH